jgi:CBS domain-containing protein
MRIDRIMSRNVYACTPKQTLADAARSMWDGDVGAVPIVDEHNRLIGMLTDRDACMAAYLRGGTLAEIRIGDVMSRDVVTCHAADAATEVARLMINAQVRRIPVVDASRYLVGIVTLNDLARAMRRSADVTPLAVAETLAGVCEPRRAAPPTS